MTTRISMNALTVACLLAIGCHAASAVADDRSEYQKRVATRYLTLFQALDRDHDGKVTRAESAGDLNFIPALAADIDGDGAVTMDELRRFIELKLGVEVQAAAR